MKTTTNIGLKKPDYTDAVDIAVINGNMDTLDTKIQEVKQQIEDIDVSWDGITGKPSTFPPSSHTHAEITTMVDRGYLKTKQVSDANLAKENGKYLVDVGGLNSPNSAWAFMIETTKQDGYDNAIQIATSYYPTGTPYTYSRKCVNGTWEAWKKADDGGNADSVDGVHFHPNNSAPVSSNPTPYFYAFNGGDDTNCYVKNASEISVNYANSAGNANALGGYTLEQIKRICGGDIVGKDMIVLPNHKIFKPTLAQWTYSNSKGGMVRLLFPNVYSSIRLTIVVDGQTIVTDTELGVFCGCSGGVDAYYNYSVDIPFTNNITIQPTYAHYDKVMYPVAYINK